MLQQAKSPGLMTGALIISLLSYLHVSRIRGAASAFRKYLAPHPDHALWSGLHDLTPHATKVYIKLVTARGAVNDRGRLFNCLNYLKRSYNTNTYCQP
jgi:hypothetical protein